MTQKSAKYILSQEIGWQEFNYPEIDSTLNGETITFSQISWDIGYYVLNNPIPKIFYSRLPKSIYFGTIYGAYFISATIGYYNNNNGEFIETLEDKSVAVSLCKAFDILGYLPPYDLIKYLQPGEFDSRESIKAYRVAKAMEIEELEKKLNIIPTEETILLSEVLAGDETSKKILKDWYGDKVCM